MEICTSCWEPLILMVVIVLVSLSRNEICLKFFQNKKKIPRNINLQITFNRLVVKRI
jgi:hypothetical protein